MGAQWREIQTDCFSILIRQNSVQKILFQIYCQYQLYQNSFATLKFPFNKIQFSHGI